NFSWLNETSTNKSNNKPTFLNQVSTNKLNTVTMLLDQTPTNKLDTETTIQNKPLTNKSDTATTVQDEPLSEESCTETTTRTIATRIKGEPNTTYPLTTAHSDVALVCNPNLSQNRIAICSSCKSSPNRNYPLYLSSIPSEIELVPLEKHRYLSSIFLYCSLGRTPEANPFTEYRILAGTMNYSQNFHSLSLYSANWLKENNPYLHKYRNSFSTTSFSHPSILIATHLPDDNNIPPVRP
ncbi:6159_t:CDS:2, partial [Cetraspora pellucida]